ncbi:MAG: helix-turn-helix domain-containing protein [Pirellulales bacterium]|nr:helix-turn-helix domain-containing protein [Pirellulales bacterium]
MLRKRVPKKHIVLEPAERDKLLKLGKELGPAIRWLITIVSYSTFRRWVRKEEGVKPTSGKGRPRIVQVIRELVVQIANDTGWGYTRILGEVKKLHVGRISRQSVKNILVEHGLDPGPKRGKGSWSEFLKIHADTLWQIDFFSKNVWTLKGPRQVFAMAFIHVGTRRVFTTPATCQPDAVWMKRQAGAFFAFAEAERLGCETIIRDLDGKYSADFDRMFADRGMKVEEGRAAGAESQRLRRAVDSEPQARGPPTTSSSSGWSTSITSSASISFIITTADRIRESAID